MTQSNFEKNGGTYTKVGDYLIPDLTLSHEEQNIHIGVWGMRHKLYLTLLLRSLFFKSCKDLSSIFSFLSESIVL